MLLLCNCYDKLSTNIHGTDLEWVLKFRLLIYTSRCMVCVLLFHKWDEK